jgi:hypothetical protein
MRVRWYELPPCGRSCADAELCDGLTVAAAPYDESHAVIYLAALGATFLAADFSAGCGSSFGRFVRAARSGRVLATTTLLT